MMTKDNRRYYLDLKENARGRFLRVNTFKLNISCSIYIFHYLQVSQTINRGGPRTQIAIPAQGMIEFRDALTDILEEFGTSDGGQVLFFCMVILCMVYFTIYIFRYKGELPEERHMKVDNKNFYFDIGQNNRGVYMRISEVSILL